MDEGAEVHAAVLDFCKAFDVVPHNLLINKMLTYDISINLIKWITHFLSSRSQCVVLVGVKSVSVPVTSSVPQGSVLGPALFLLYIKDIVYSIQESNIRLFADDTLIYRSIRCPGDALALQKDLEKVHKWSLINMMKFNTSKSNIVFSNTKESNNLPTNYVIANVTISKSSVVKYLGITLQANNSRWNTHITGVIAKARKILGIVKHTLFDAPTEIKQLAYYTMPPYLRIWV